jgi:hypothetical protein
MTTKGVTRNGRARAKAALKAATNGHVAPTCGDNGGLGLQGQVCTREAGWGTEHRGTGRCQAHDDVAEAERQALKSRFLEDFRTGRVSREKAAQGIGVGATQVWRWRQADAAFDAAVKQAEQESDQQRVGMVEDSMFGRIVAGKASPAETIFFLVNRGGGRWRHIQTIQHTGGNDDTPIRFKLDLASASLARLHE